MLTGARSPARSATSASRPASRSDSRLPGIPVGMARLHSGPRLGSAPAEGTSAASTAGCPYKTVPAGQNRTGNYLDNVTFRRRGRRYGKSRGMARGATRGRSCSTLVGGGSARRRSRRWPVGSNRSAGGTPAASGPPLATRARTRRRTSARCCGWTASGRSPTSGGRSGWRGRTCSTS